MKSNSFNVWRQEKTKVPAPQERNDLPFLCFFVPFGPSRDWTMPPQSEGESLYLVCWIKCRSFEENCHRFNSVSPDIWASYKLIKLMHKINHHKDIYQFIEWCQCYPDIKTKCRHYKKIKLEFISLINIYTKILIKP